MSKVKATYGGFVGFEGVPVLLHEGEEYDAGHPLVAARPELFSEPVSAPKRPVLRGKKAAEEPQPPAKGKAAGG